MKTDRIELARMAFCQLSKTERLEFLRTFAPDVPKVEATAALQNRIIRRLQAAERFSVSPRTLDRWAHAGLLKKRVMPGHVRAAGFVESEVAALVEGTK